MSYYVERVAGKRTMIRHRSPRIVKLFQTLFKTDKFVFMFEPKDEVMFHLINAALFAFGVLGEKTMPVVERELAAGRTVDLHYSVHPMYKITDRGRV